MADPMTGRNIIEDRERHPLVDEGNLTIYFESEKTRKPSLDMPINQPVPKLPGAPSAKTIAADGGASSRMPELIEAVSGMRVNHHQG